MARLSDLPSWEQEVLLRLRDQAPRFDAQPWVSGPPLRERRVALVTTAGLHRRSERPFDGAASPSATDYRVIPADTPAGELVMSHLSVNFDRTGFQQDINVVFPLQRLQELAAEGEVGSVAEFHYSFMGAPWPPTRFEGKARELADLLKRDAVDGVMLGPV